jgi:hypothetical protein
MTKGNWVGGLNARLDQTDNWVGKKNMVEYEIGRKIEKEILAG